MDESGYRDLLDNIIDRLEKIDVHSKNQPQTDQILERLDTIHNRLERQNQKQHALDDKISHVSSQLEQEKVFMRDQLQAAQNEILRRLTELQEKGEEIIKIHGPSSQDSLDVTKTLGDTDEGIQEHSINTSLDPFDKEDQNPVHDLIRTDFDQLKKSLKDTLEENQQNLGKEISRNTEIVSAQLHEFREMTKVQIVEQTAGMNGKLGNVVAAHEDLKRQMITCEEKLTTVELTTQQHVKDGVMFAVNELRNSTVTHLKKFFTKKTLVCLVLLSAVVLAVWYKSEGLASVKSQIIHQMDNTKAEIVSATSNGTKHIMDKLDKMGFSPWYVPNEKLYIKHSKDIKAKHVSMKKERTQRTLDESQHTGHESGNAMKSEEFPKTFEKIKSELLSVTKLMAQQILDELRHTGDKLCNVMKVEQDFSEGTSNATEVVRSAATIKTLLQSLDKEAIHMLKLLNVTLQQEGTSFNGTTKDASLFQAITNAIISCAKNMSFYVPILLLSIVTLFRWFISATREEIKSITKKTKREIISVTDKSKRDIISFTEKENQLLRDRIAGPLPSRQTYIFDFYVENFQQLVRSDTGVTSLPWHITQLSTSVSGHVVFKFNGDMTVMLINSRHPLEVGLEPKLYGRLKFKATITDTSGGLPDHELGDTMMRINEEGIKNNEYWGREIGVVSCDELIKKGYGEKECYWFGALLIRYEIMVE